jgi:paraquat-inducible protein A
VAPHLPSPVPDRLHACRSCGLIQHVPLEGGPLAPGFLARCARCRCTVAAADTPESAATRRRSMSRAAAFALAALILYPLAMSLPVIEIQRLGARREATIWSGAVQLMADHQVIVGLIVFLCSIVIPLLKIGGMFIVCAGGARAFSHGPILRPHHRLHTYRAIDFLGRWGMIDVLLVAILIAAVKLGNWVQVHPGPGTLAFAAVVILSMLSSAVFNPAAIWDETA